MSFENFQFLQGQKEMCVRPLRKDAMRIYFVIDKVEITILDVLKQIFLPFDQMAHREATNLRTYKRTKRRFSLEHEVAGDQASLARSVCVNAFHLTRATRVERLSKRRVWWNGMRISPVQER